MRPPTVNKARPGHERETEIKLFDYFKSIVRTCSFTHTGGEDRAWKAPEPTLAAQDVCSVHVCVACPLSRLGAGGNDRARAATPGLRLQIALLIFCLFSSINTLSCRTVHTKTIFPQRSLRGCVFFVFVFSVTVDVSFYCRHVFKILILPQEMQKLCDSARTSTC